MKTLTFLHKKYSKPQLLKIGKLSKLTIKTGSISDFGSNKFSA